RTAGRAPEAAPPRPRVPRRGGFHGAITNPKALPFFTPFLPPFVDRSSPWGRPLFLLCARPVVRAGLAESARPSAMGLPLPRLVKPREQAGVGGLSGLVLIGGGLWLSVARRTA